MRQPGSLWSEVWSGAEPVPAHRQKKLFDDTREAEKVLHYLAGLKTAELGLLVLPVLIHCAIHALKEKHGVCVSVCVCACAAQCVCVVCVCARARHGVCVLCVCVRAFSLLLKVPILCCCDYNMYANHMYMFISLI